MSGGEIAPPVDQRPTQFPASKSVHMSDAKYGILDYGKETKAGSSPIKTSSKGREIEYLSSQGNLAICSNNSNKDVLYLTNHQPANSSTKEAPLATLKSDQSPPLKEQGISPMKSCASEKLDDNGRFPCHQAVQAPSSLTSYCQNNDNSSLIRSDPVLLHTGFDHFTTDSDATTTAVGVGQDNDFDSYDSDNEAGDNPKDDNGSHINDYEFYESKQSKSREALGSEEFQIDQSIQETEGNDEQPSMGNDGPEGSEEGSKN